MLEPAFSLESSPTKTGKSNLIALQLMSEIDGAIHCEIIAGGGGRNKASFAYSPEVYLQLCCFTLSGFFSIFAEILPRRLRRIMQMSPGFFSVFSEFWPEILWDVWVTTRGTSGPSKFFQDSFKILSRFFQDSFKILEGFLAMLGPETVSNCQSSSGIVKNPPRIP